MNIWHMMVIIIIIIINVIIITICKLQLLMTIIWFYDFWKNRLNNNICNLQL